jgi:hypothetical protein
MRDFLKLQIANCILSELIKYQNSNIPFNKRIELVAEKLIEQFNMPVEKELQAKEALKEVGE